MLSQLKKFRKGDLIGFGNPLLDIRIEVTPEYLTKHSLPFNNQLRVNGHQIFDDLVNQNPEILPGGSALNTLRVLQWLIGKPNVCVFFGAMGRDDYAKFLAQCVTESGVDARYQIVDHPTGACAALICGQGRTLVSRPGAAQYFHEKHIAANWDGIMNANYFYLTGYFLSVCPNGVLRVCRHSTELRKTIALNSSAPFIARNHADSLCSVMPHVDVLFRNREEFDALSNETDAARADLRGIGLRWAKYEKASQIDESASRVVIITDGANPVLLIVGSHIEAIKVPTVDSIVDTNGAGDAFCAGYLFALMSGKCPVDCVYSGCSASSIVLQQHGCSLPTFFQEYDRTRL